MPYLIDSNKGSINKIIQERRSLCIQQLVPTSKRLPTIVMKMFGHSLSGKSTLIESLTGRSSSTLFTKFFMGSKVVAANSIAKSKLSKSFSFTRLFQALRNDHREESDGSNLYYCKYVYLTMENLHIKLSRFNLQLILEPKS